METIIGIFSGGVSGALLVWLLRGWISERLKQSIRNEYSQKLETHKAELNTRIQAIQHENQLHRLRTSLFFDHQRNAFAALLAKVAEVNQRWIDEAYVQDEGLTEGVPYEAYQDLRKTFYQHQLFLDRTCLAAMELVFECYTDSFPFDDGSGAPPRQRNPHAPYDAIEYLQPRLAELFQRKIGVSGEERAEREIVLFGAIRLLNRYNFPDVGLPPKGALAIDRRDEPAESVAKAQQNIAELLAALKGLQNYLRRDGAVFHEAAMKADRYLSVLQPPSDEEGGPTKE